SGATGWKGQCMSLEVMAIVLFAAALHAAWNAIVRASADKFLDTVMIVLGAGVWTAALLPLMPTPAVESWPYLAASVVIHVAYFVLVAVSYRGGELSFVYPLMRGSAPALTAVAGLLLINESPSPGGWAGVLLISCGVLVLAGDSLRSGTFHIAPAAFALTNAGVIVVYTIIDGQGARLSGHALSYTGWMFMLTAPLLLLIAGVGQGRGLVWRIRRGWRTGLVGGACTLASYALALWAMTRAPIALVAALRETSVVFAAIFAAAFLNEPISRVRYVSIVVVCAGAMAIKLF
ncbi:MAG: DMT family transporter, partial [Sulfuritalea sp.]|nr:DMT family transporter [Sulfuritalea sp.]